MMSEDTIEIKVAQTATRNVWSVFKSTPEDPKNAEWYFNCSDLNGKILIVSGEGYKNRDDCVKIAERFGYNGAD